jgi:hypothetical protein
MKTYNSVDLKGRLFNYGLTTISTEKGEAIGGDVLIEVDTQGTIVTVRFFGYPTYNSGKPNKTYAILDDMMAGNYKTLADHGDDADWLGVSASIDVGYFVGKNQAPGEDISRSQKVRGSFINPNKEKGYSNKWKLDTIITNISEIDADEEKQLERFVKVNGFLIDDYNKRVMEVGFQARSEGAINYLLSLEPSLNEPYYVSMWGQITKVSRLIVRKSAFGEDLTEEYNSLQWVITGMSPESYEWGDERIMSDGAYVDLRAALAEHKQEVENKAISSIEEGGKTTGLVF